MTRRRLQLLVLPALAASLLAGCGKESIELDGGENDRVADGARIFADKCSGCHTLESAGTQGSAVNVRDRERTDGPNFNTRPEMEDAVLYAIRNGGFSGAIMPENIVVGDDAKKVAEYLSKYAGRDAEKPVSPQSGGATP
ncbi:MAG TPA: c-type cytochrome [Solirubrobacteraceae bacterium]|jgi:mono/diheme cytochrome c family protein